MYLFFILLFVAQASYSTLDPKPIFYFSSEEAQRQIQGTWFRKALGGKEYRKFYGEVLNDPIETRALETVFKYINNWPTPVLTRKELFSRGDNNCSIPSNFINSVDISVPCQNHDYCFRKLPDDRHYDQYENFLKCNRKFAEDIVQLCQIHQKSCSLSKIYHGVLDYFSFFVYRQGQALQAKMSKQLVLTLIKNPKDKEIADRSSFFSLDQISNQYLNYCEVIHERRLHGEILLPEERSVCF